MHRDTAADTSKVGCVCKRRPGGSHIGLDGGATQCILKNAEARTGADIEESRVYRTHRELLCVIGDNICFKHIPILIAKVVNVIQSKNTEPVPVRLGSE